MRSKFTAISCWGYLATETDGTAGVKTQREGKHEQKGLNADSNRDGGSGIPAIHHRRPLIALTGTTSRRIYNIIIICSCKISSDTADWFRVTAVQQLTDSRMMKRRFRAGACYWFCCGIFLRALTRVLLLAEQCLDRAAGKQVSNTPVHERVRVSPWLALCCFNDR